MLSLGFEAVKIIMFGPLSHTKMYCRTPVLGLGLGVDFRRGILQKNPPVLTKHGLILEKVFRQCAQPFV